ncbi:hypothetical protein L0Z72_11410 [candidate division KSB1 bacterium]|nr:hypothetical protein [candidate division KSB1 bacterium]
MPTLGDFYKEKILSQKNLVHRELPAHSGKIEIKQDLFGCKLLFGKKDFLECRTEEEARYLKVWMESGVREISVPQDEEYLKVIVPELEELKKKIDQVIHDYTFGILNRKIRDRIRREVYQEITQ